MIFEGEEFLPYKPPSQFINRDEPGRVQEESLSRIPPVRRTSQKLHLSLMHPVSTAPTRQSYWDRS